MSTCMIIYMEKIKRQIMGSIYCVEIALDLGSATAWLLISTPPTPQHTLILTHSVLQNTSSPSPHQSLLRLGLAHGRAFNV